ncbi:hypothetical protein O6R05_01855 [Peptoniphilus equinus]|uniref:ABC-2 family transporter protein n=1 Tax=Peptoniphilus equinus TaxID=3016343 RepID=A0ABY7QVN0_9FIRM|nr:hypothetical protein [Peptoniphilus equinus]WBW50310.1 hypothetical protein O6R05_01855 [Peptoniphilus equinus]
MRQNLFYILFFTVMAQMNSISAVWKVGVTSEIVILISTMTLFFVSSIAVQIVVQDRGSGFVQYLQASPLNLTDYCKGVLGGFYLLVIGMIAVFGVIQFILLHNVNSLSNFIAVGMGVLLLGSLYTIAVVIFGSKWVYYGYIVLYVGMILIQISFAPQLTAFVTNHNNFILAGLLLLATLVSNGLLMKFTKTRETTWAL